MRHFIWSALCATFLFSGCGFSGALTTPESAGPKSVQCEMSVDWTYALNPKETFYLGAKPIELGHVAVTKDITFVASSALSRVAAITNDKATKIWDKTLTAPVSAGPVLQNNDLYVALGDGGIVKLNAKTGEQIWRYDTTVPIEQSLVVKDGVVACVNANNRLFVLDANTGAVKWRRERPRAKEFTMYGQATPLIHNNVLYAGFSDGNLIAYSLLNGTIIWARDLAPDARFKDLDVQPVIVDDVIYAANSSGGIYALDVLDGRTIWQRDIHGASSIIAHQNNLYISSQSGVFKLDRDTGDTIWQNEIQKDALISPLQLGKSSIYASVQRLGLVAIDRATGRTEHIIDMGTDFTSAPVLTNGVLTAISNRSTVYRFLVDDSPL